LCTSVTPADEAIKGKPMQLTRLLATAALAGGLGWGAPAALAGPLTVDGGWAADTTTVLNAPSDNSPWTFTFGAAGGYFSITDAFIVTDIYTVTDSVLGLIITTAPGLIAAVWTTPSDPTGDAAWADSSYSKGQVFLPAGSYSLTVENILDQGLPAGLYVRADNAEAVAAPAALALFGLGLLGLGLVRRRDAV
jgi:hypothetical protein